MRLTNWLLLADDLPWNIVEQWLVSIAGKEKKEHTCIFKRQGWEPIHKKYKENKSPRTHVMKDHNNEDTTNTLIK
jgi:hypothetical protein